MLNSLVCNSLTFFETFLITVASGIVICSTVSISSFGGILSTPGDLLSFSIVPVILSSSQQRLFKQLISRKM